MTDATYSETVLEERTVQELRWLQGLIGKRNAEQGFRLESNELLFYATGDLADERDQANLRNYYSMKLGLIVTEVAEAIEELRNGRAVNETYYPEAPFGGNAVHETGYPAKPEGVPSEIADIVIRAFDFADEVGIDLAAIIDEKLAYNATRPFMHGKKA